MASAAPASDAAERPKPFTDNRKHNLSRLRQWCRLVCFVYGADKKDMESIRNFSVSDVSDAEVGTILRTYGGDLGLMLLWISQASKVTDDIAAVTFTEAQIASWKSLIRTGESTDAKNAVLGKVRKVLGECDEAIAAQPESPAMSESSMSDDDDSSSRSSSD